MVEADEKAPSEEEEREVARKQELTIRFRLLRSTIFIVLMIPLLVWLVVTNVVRPAMTSPGRGVAVVELLSLLLFFAMSGALVVYYVVQFVLEKRGAIYPEPASLTKLLVPLVLIILLAVVMLAYRLSTPTVPQDNGDGEGARVVSPDGSAEPPRSPEG